MNRHHEPEKTRGGGQLVPAPQHPQKERQEAHVLKEMEARLKQRTITSPVDGVVVKRSHSPGEFVQDDVILNLAQIDPLRVEVVVPVRLYGKVRVGMRADVEWELPGLGLQRATVKVVDPVGDAASGTIGIRLELPNPKHELPAGTKCWVRFPISAERPAGKADGGRAEDQGPRNSPSARP